MTKFFLSCIESHFEDPKNLYALLKIGPFEKNYTLTVANNLRRALLSELEGVAITAVKILGVRHEYTSLQGVHESVLDILLNTKQIAISSAFTSQTPTIAYLNCSGPRIVKAGDIQLPPFMKCLNPEHQIATLGPDGQLTMAFFICPGKNYWVQLGSNKLMQRYEEAFPSVTRQFQECFNSTNILPIDAVFMPINKVNYTIEVEEEIDTEKPYEHIFFEIWTNGTIHPVAAIRLAGIAINQFLKPFEELHSIQPRFFHTKPIKGLLNTEALINARGIPGAEDEPTESGKNPSPLLDLDIGNLDLSLRPYTCLKRANIHTIRDLLEYSGDELLLFKNFGKRSLEEVQNSLFQMGFFLPEKNK